MAQWVNPDPPAARMELCRSRKSVLGNIYIFNVLGAGGPLKLQTHHGEIPH